MTLQELNAMKLALEALELLTDTEQTFGALDYGDNAITALEEALAEHAMSEVQRLGQEIEQEPVCPDCKAKVLYECVACSSNNYPPQPEQEPVAWMHVQGNYKEPSFRELADDEVERGWEQFPLYNHPPQRIEQKMVMWPCLIDTADFSKGTVTVVMQCDDYKVSAGTHWLSTTPPQRTWVGLTGIDQKALMAMNARDAVFATEAKLKEKNT